MNDISKEKKMQVLEVPKITNTARQVANQRKEQEIIIPKKMNKRLSKTAGLDKAVIRKFIVYIGIAVIVALIKIVAIYNVNSLDVQLKNKNRELKDLKKEVSSLENKFYDGIDRRRMEKKAYEDGFVPNDPIKYITIENKNKAK
ncbi:hypothetical protein [Leptotrichia sp. oral taxon 847]|uniref:hypothetical protein n=1 Tax=Leptotrichia sp. oral taxon 847 TaxID=1785996 RepID=UPI0007684285|nr:hypothetical protein [Leptotrichia sp. oral taxon 847]AMD95701.1 hypothetical protein AXF11_09010 [Leptotrichia sp. oral taxon 847]